MEITWNMTIGEIGQIAALSTAIVISLYLGVRSLRQTKSLQERHIKQTRRQELINEIINWANDVIECGSTIELPATPEEIKMTRHLRRIQATKLLLKFQTINSRSEYIRDVALVFSEDLANAVTLVANGLTKIAELIHERIKNIDDEALTQQTSELELAIYEDARKVVVAAAAFKTEDIERAY